MNMKAHLRIVPDYEVIVCPPEESFRWYMHDYPFYLAKWNYHPEYELHLTRSTSGTMMVGDFLGDFGPGSLILTGPNVPHNWVSNIPPGETVRNRDMLIQFTPDFADKVANFSPELAAVRALYDDAAFGVEFLGAAAFAGRKILSEIGGVHGADRVILFLQLMDVLSRSPIQRRRLSRLAPALKAELPRSIDMAMRFMNEAHAEDIDLAEVAARAGLTPQTFSRLFKRQTGHTFASYLVLTRIYFACTLLTQTHQPVTQICFEIGFNNIANFNRQFLKICGRSPSDYRKIAHRIGSDMRAASPSAPVCPQFSGGKV
jgi:AraC-like DNA-binding protein